MLKLPAYGILVTQNVIRKVTQTVIHQVTENAISCHCSGNASERDRQHNGNTTCTRIRVTRSGNRIPLLLVNKAISFMGVKLTRFVNSDT